MITTELLSIITVSERRSFSITVSIYLWLVIAASIWSKSIISPSSSFCPWILLKDPRGRNVLLEQDSFQNSVRKNKIRKNICLKSFTILSIYSNPVMLTYEIQSKVFSCGVYMRYYDPFFQRD